VTLSPGGVQSTLGVAAISNLIRVMINRVPSADAAFDPPLRLATNRVIRTIDDAVAFARSFEDATLPLSRDAVVRRLEATTTRKTQQAAASMFRTWLSAEGLLKTE
jgi:hypothetical protein